jgi:protein-disulfide isomerase
MFLFEEHMKRSHMSLCIAVVIAATVSVGGQQATLDAVRVGDRVITLQEVDDAWRLADAGKYAEATQALYDGRRATIDKMVAGILLDKEAAAKKVTVQELLAEETARRRKAVTQADVDAFYNANKEQMQGNPLEKMQDPIRRFLQDQQETAARDAYVAELRKAGPPVRVLLEPPRTEVALTANDPSRGTASAPVTIVEFSDFQCPFCARVAPTLRRLRDTYGERVRIVWKDFPLANIHKQATKAAEAAHCAAEQGKYWEFHDRLFANQAALLPDDLKRHAAAVGMDAPAFNACFDSGRYAGRVEEGVTLGRRLGVDSTPTVFINGRVVAGAQPYETFSAIVDEELARQQK